ncbi:Cytochrome b561 [Aspergillus sp. HF37]|nr:Cytochrome b561 [Aspergillus sp. HF37]
MTSPQNNHDVPENEPLIGSPSAAPSEDAGIYRNLVTGTATVAQAGILILAALIWSGIFSADLNLFSAHPLLNSSALLLQVQATLVLQPTTTAVPKHKLLGTRIHYTVQALSALAFLAAFIVIEVNKGDHPRLVSPHGILGLITYIAILLQALLGVTQYFLPRKVLGSVDAGKSLYKYHRWYGYALLLLELATVSAATRTTYNLTTLHIQLWTVLVAAVLVAAGVGARVRKHKLGL